MQRRLSDTRDLGGACLRSRLYKMMRSARKTQHMKVIIRSDIVCDMHIVLFDRSRISAVFATDSNFQRGIEGSAIFHGHFDQLADPLGVDCNERIVQEDSVLEVCRKESTYIISRVAKRHLGQII